MQINASSSNSINFIEQKKSNLSSSNQKNSTDLNRADSFVGETNAPNSLIELNESLSKLQIAGDTMLQLKSNGEALQKLIQKYVDFPSQELELSEKFEEITVKMLDIVDNTMMKETQLFYTTHSFKIGSSELELTMSNDYGIEDLNLSNAEKLNHLDTKISLVKQQVDEIKKQIELANFNTMASLEKNSPMLDIKRNVDYEDLTLSAEDMKRAHDTNSLKDKMSFLLGD